MSGSGFHILTKPIGPICNLDCKYCFYLEKEALYPDVSKWSMSDDVLESYVHQYIETQPMGVVHFAWQGESRHSWASIFSQGCSTSGQVCEWKKDRERATDEWDFAE